jgi:uncharacterized membrane protein YccC
MMTSVHPLRWLRRHDRDLVALRRAARAAILMPTMFAIGDKLIGNADVATFAAFGSFALLLLVDFTGTIRERVQAQTALGVTGAVFVAIGTLCSRNVWLAAAAMILVGFAVLFIGVVSSVLAAATTSMLLSFILPVSLTGPISAIPDRLAGWAMASVVAVFAIAVLWPAPVRDPLRHAAATACRTLAARLRSDLAYMMSGSPGHPDEAFARDHARAAKQSDEAVAALHAIFLATPYRPTGLSTVNRTIIRLVDEINWLDGIVVQSGPHHQHTLDPAVRDVKLGVCSVLERAADLLETSGGDGSDLQAAMAELDGALAAMEERATGDLPTRKPQENSSTGADMTEFISSFDPSFRAQELSFVAAQIGRNVGFAGAAERRSWPERLLGHQPDGVTGALSAASERASAHVERHSVWLHNSVRAAIGLGLAVFVANQSGVQHSFWVVLGTLSVLRSNALNTGQNVLRALIGTVAGFVIGAGLLAAIGTDETLLWFLLPVAILIAGVAPAAISFAAGQAGFTLVLVILFNIIQPAGWRVGLLRVEDIAIGCAVSLVVGVLFWPRGARAALRQALAEAYTDSAGYLARAVDFGVACCDPARGLIPAKAPTGEALRAAAAARRLDDAFRGYLAEPGAKPLPLPEVTSLITGVAGIRLAADAVTELWARDNGTLAGSDRTLARQELVSSSELVKDWYDELAASLLTEQPLPEPLSHDRIADGRLVAAVRHDLTGADGRASQTAVRMIWTGDHLDAVRRLQTTVIGPARDAAAARALGPLAGILPGRQR